MRTIIIALLLSTTAASAGSYNHTTTCARYGGSVSCKSEGYSTGYYGPRSYAVPSISEVGSGPMTAAEEAERNERIRKWEAFCTPVGTVDALGVTRLSYAHEGCENGRSE